jgi:hypothetical protein
MVKPTGFSPARIFAAAAVLLLAAAGCMQSGNPVAKRGSEVENEVYGVLVDGSGKRAQGAWVRVQAAKGFPLPDAPGGQPAGALDSALTDAQGRYAFAGLSPGEYNLVANRDQGALVAFIPRVIVVETRPKLDIGTDTLRAPGSILGRITQGGAGKEGVLAYLPGTGYLAFSDSNGDFRVGGVPQGTYSVEYLIASLAADPDTAVSVLAGRATVLPPKELGYDTALPPPAPYRVRAVLDTPSSIVRVDWGPVRVADLLGYLVYRDTGTFSSPELRTKGILTDTAFFDTVITLAKSPFPPVLTYRVLSVDRNKNPSTRYSPPAQANLAPPQSATLQVTLRQLEGKKNRAGINDTLRYEASYANPGRAIRQVVWSIADSATPARIREDSSHSGHDTLAYAWPAAGKYKLSLRVAEESGFARLVSWEIQVVQDVPLADAGSDRNELAGDTVHLYGIGIQEFGTIERYEWDVGATGRFQEAPRSGLDFVAPAPGPAIPCVLRVTDEDGNQGLDTVRITPVPDRPEADAGADLEATASDTIRLAGQAHDPLASIVKWEWDAGGTGRFLASGPDTVIRLPALDSGTFPCILRVTSDHGGVGLDTILVRIVPDAPTADLRAMPSEVAAGGQVTLSGAASLDGHGSIVRWEWDIGATGRFLPGSKADTTFVVPTAGTMLRCALRVTDDDGKMDTARIDVPIRPAGTWTRLGEFSSPDDVTNLSAVGTGLGKFWFLGQKASGGVWSVPVLLSTPDFRTWETSTMDSSWMNNSQNPMVFESGGRLWGITNQNLVENRVWSSPDGVQWTLVSTPKELRFRCGYAVIPFADRMWILGGMDSFDRQPMNEIWSSRDGVDWVREAAAPAFGERLVPQAATLDGQIWLYGGTTTALDGFTNEVWRSPDGRTWTKVGNGPAVPAQSNIAFLANAGQLWVLHCGNASVPVAAAWHSRDGKSWAKNPDPPGFPASEGSLFLGLGGRLWMFEIGGDGLLSRTAIWAGP